MSNLIKRKFIHLIAILAVLTGSLAPSISQAISVVQDGKGLAVEVCTTTGVKMTVVIADQDSAETKKATEHCPYCVMHGAYALPVNTELSFAEPDAHQLYPQLFYQSPKPLFAWVSLPSRAPPSLV
jgi:hypothetical protein